MNGMRLNEVVLVGKKVGHSDEYTQKQNFIIGKAHWPQIDKRIADLHEEAKRYQVTLEIKEIEYELEREFRIVLRGKAADVRMLWKRFTENGIGLGIK